MFGYFSSFSAFSAFLGENSLFPQMYTFGFWCSAKKVPCLIYYSAQNKEPSVGILVKDNLTQEDTLTDPLFRV